jgi:drug/metabolite transporter (DMT)-like permease
VSRSLKAHLLLVFITFVWGTTFVVIKNALADISPLLFNTLRMLLATACLAAVYWKKIVRIKSDALKSGAIIGVLLWAGYEFQTTGLRLTTPSKSAFITGVSVVLVPTFLVLFWGRKINRWSTLGVAAAFAGLALMTIPAGSADLADWSSVNRGDVLTFGCSIAFGLHIIFLGRATQKHSFAQMAFLQTVIAAGLMCLTVPALEKPHVNWTPQLLVAIAVTGVLCTAVAFSIQSWAQQSTPPTHTALIFALEPVFAWLTSYVVQGERLGIRVSFGALLILAGILVSELYGGVGTASPRPALSGIE